jgi:hypothetical protein
MIESDRSLLSYIKYLNSVLYNVDNADLWARVCESNHAFEPQM